MALSAGDIAIIGVNTDNPDEFAFVALVDIAAGEEITFTDSGWQGTAFRPNEGAVRWTAPAGGITAGTVISFSGVGGDWVAANDANVGTNGFNLSASGDQVIAFQGDSAAPTFLFAVQTNSTEWQTGSNDANQSDLPTGLVIGETAVAVGAGSGAESEFDNSTYNDAVTSGTQAELLAAIANQANWSGNNTRIDPLSSGPFTVNAAVSNTPTEGDDVLTGDATDESIDGLGGNDQISGGAGTDFIYGGEGDDIIDAEAGNGVNTQLLFGQGGNDTYNYSKEDGKVMIAASAENATSGTADTVVFDDLASTDISFSFIDFSKFSYGGDQTTIVLSWDDGNSSGSLKIADEGQEIETYQFTDQTLTAAELLALAEAEVGSIIGQDGVDDFLVGTGADETLDARGGTGTRYQNVAGRDGDDTYIYDRTDGPGFVYIFKDAETYNGGDDTLVLDGFDSSDFTFLTRDYDATSWEGQNKGEHTSLRMTWGDDGNGGPEGSIDIAEMGRHIETFQFDDITMTYDELIAFTGL